MVDVREFPSALHNQRPDPVATQEPWLLTENDIPWLISLGKKRYGEKWDYQTVETWFRNIVLKSPLMFHHVRLNNAFLISMTSCNPWAPAALECNTVLICADEGAHWEAVALVRAAVEWARKRKCVCWRMASDTHVDLANIARRIGATEISPRFTVRFDNG